MQARKPRRDKNAEARREAAARLLSLRGKGEGDAEFARRLDLELSTISNYVHGVSGLDLGILSRARLTSEEALYVIRGGEPPPAVTVPSQSALQELREWLDTVQLPTSRASGGRAPLTLDEMAELLRAHRWKVIPPLGRTKDGGGGGGG